jgi:hypothetical protein
MTFWTAPIKARLTPTPSLIGAGTSGKLRGKTQRRDYLNGATFFVSLDKKGDFCAELRYQQYFDK